MKNSKENICDKKYDKDIFIDISLMVTLCILMIVGFSVCVVFVLTI